MELPVIEWKEDEKVTRDEKCRGGGGQKEEEEEVEGGIEKEKEGE